MQKNDENNARDTIGMIEYARRIKYLEERIECKKIKSEWILHKIR